MAERERKAEEEHEATLSAARPALIFCRVVDALQSALKRSSDGSRVSAPTSRAAQQGALEVFLTGGDDLLFAASRAAHEAYESAVKPLGDGGGVVENLRAMGLKDAFGAVDVVAGGEGREERGEKELAAACRERVMNLLCEGELVAIASARSLA